MEVNTVAPTHFAKQVRKALGDWHKPSRGKSPLAELSLFNQCLQTTQLNHRRVTNEVLAHGIERLKDEQADYADYLRLRYLDEKSIIAIALMKNISESTAYEVQKSALEWLVNTLWDMERENRHQRQSRMRHRLDAADYVALVGRESDQEEIFEQLNTAEAPYIISVTGIGGMGKTALADSLLRQVIREGPFDEIGWITVRQQRLSLMAQIETLQPVSHNVESIVRQLCLQLMPDFPLPTSFDLDAAIKALERQLRQVPHLIVIDNLETLADVRDLDPVLQRLTNPSKFLLTSREALYGQPHTFHYSLRALSEEHALNLVRQEAERSNLPVLAESSDEELSPIYATVGGNPLALRLIVGLAHHQGLEDILGDLKIAQNETADQLYTYIYRQAWDKLNELDRHVLLTMSTIQPNGEELDIVMQNSGLSRSDVRIALSSLIILSLVDVRGVPPTRRYRIHSLTKSFLLEQVLLW